MLSHISHKFAQPAKEQMHEPRAALFLNRFTRTLTVMYATNGLEEVVGIPAETMRGRSFYYCIAENCLQDAIKCLENAKGNDSIAYLRFWFRDPRVDDPPPDDVDDSDEEMTTDISEDFSEGGVNLQSPDGTSPNSSDSSCSNAVQSTGSMEVDTAMDDNTKPDSRTSSGDSMNERDTHAAIFGENQEAHSSTSSLNGSPERNRASPPRPLSEPVELEAVVSCTSDGLVVCLRKARPMIPHPTSRPSKPVYENGLFAAPWATDPILPPIDTRPRAGFGNGFAPSLGPHGARHDSTSPARAVRPHQSDFMSAIREQAIFAWALTGINGSLAEFGQGKPLGEAMPSDGLPVWASDPRQSQNGWDSGQDMLGSANRSPQDSRHGPHLFGDPGLDRNGNSGSRSLSSSNGNSSGGTPFSR